MSLLVGETVGRKVSRTIGGITSGRLCTVKWSPYEDFDEAGVEIATATLQQLITGLDVLANGAGDTNLNAYTGASGAAGQIRYADGNANTVGKVIDIINGVGVGQPAPGVAGYSTRYRAALADCRPGVSLDANSGIAIGANNILIGLHDDGLYVFIDGANTPSVAHRIALGTGRGREGGGQVFADHFESDYFSDVAGNRLPVRDERRRREEQPGLARYQVHITKILYNAAWANNDKVINVYDINDNLVRTIPIGAGTEVLSVTEESPLVMPPGSPAFIEGTGTGALTDGPFSAVGYVRIA